MSIENIRSKMIESCKISATNHINDTIAPHRRENISLWGSGYGVTKDQLGAFVLSVTTACDHYEAVIESADEPESIIIDYSDITP